MPDLQPGGCVLLSRRCSLQQPHALHFWWRIPSIFEALLTISWRHLLISSSYNFSSHNLAEHGLHPHWLHVFVNLPMLVGPRVLWLAVRAVVDRTKSLSEKHGKSFEVDVLCQSKG